MYKKLLKISLIAMCAGLILSVAAFAFTGFDYESLFPKVEHETKIYTPETGVVKNINIDSDYGFVRLANSEDNNIHIEYDVTKELDCNFILSGDTLTADYKYARRPWYYTMKNGIFAGIDIESYGMVVKLPVGYAGNLNIHTSDWTTSKEPITIDGTVTITSDNGFSKIENLGCTNLTVISNNSTVNASNVTVSGNVNISSDNGAIRSENLTAQNIQLESDNGYIKIENITAAESTRISSDNGAINFTALLSPKIELLSDNGYIRGTVKGRESDYQIAVSTKNGYTNLSSHIDPTRPFILTAESENGSVNVEFEE